MASILAQLSMDRTSDQEYFGVWGLKVCGGSVYLAGVLGYSVI